MCSDENNRNKMTKNQITFWDHFSELRSRLVQCLVLFLFGFLAAYCISDRILFWLRKPLFSQLAPERQHLYYTSLFENFLVHLKLSGYASLILLSPVYFLIIWRFVAPGLHEREKKNVTPFAWATAFFFIVGVCFAYYILLPLGVRYFLSYGTTAEVAWLTLDSYVSLVIRILIGFGLCFEMPVLIILLAKLGIVSAENLSRHRKTAIISIALLAAFVAPPDAMSMLLLMAPLYLLFEIAVGVVKRIEKTTKS